MTSFFDRNIGRISGSVQRRNHLTRDLEQTLNLDEPDYLNAEKIKQAAEERHINLSTKQAQKLLARIKKKQAGWGIA